MNTRLHLRYHKGELMTSYAEIYANPINDGDTISPELTKSEFGGYVDLLISELETIKKEAANKFSK